MFIEVLLYLKKGRSAISFFFTAVKLHRASTSKQKARAGGCSWNSKGSEFYFAGREKLPCNYLRRVKVEQYSVLLLLLPTGREGKQFLLSWDYIACGTNKQTNRQKGRTIEVHGSN